ncbi:MAG TPA: hypothetical protein VFQ35_06000 [Polyangiaceae bacterium]|nr:hypothetical protein [Polyangiaceae bacterium]
MQRGLLAAAYLGAALVGYLLGGEQAYRRALAASSAAARVGFALRTSAPVSAQLGYDVERVREELKADERDLLDLVVATRGLTRGGEPDWAAAEAVCRSNGHLRCDRPALERLRLGSYR